MNQFWRRNSLVSLSLERAADDDLPALHAILVLCGEHMARTQSLSHWYPFLSLDQFSQGIDSAHLYAVYEDQFLVGTFHLKTKPRPYYPAEYWADPDAKAFYFSALGVLPSFQGRGIGGWCMAQAERIAAENGCSALRFDAVGNNAPLLRFYDRLGYERRGIIDFPDYDFGHTVCYERILRR
jgi:GNAT superfamily N-acetyltransferase